MNTIAPTHPAAMPAAVAGWKRRVLRISSLCEILFGSIWIANALRPHIPVAAAVVLATGAIMFAISVRATRGSAPRPSGPQARALERRITIATVVQIVATLVFPVVLAPAGLGSFVLPAIVASVGVLFVWLGRELHIPRLRALGIALVVVPIAAMALLPASAQTTALLAAAGTLMLATGARGARTVS